MKVKRKMKRRNKKYPVIDVSADVRLETKVAYSNHYQGKGPRARLQPKTYNQIKSNYQGKIATIIPSKHSVLQDKRYKCNICNKTYVSIKSLNRHNNIHREDNPYKCYLCLKAFGSRPDVKRHELICKRSPPVNADLPLDSVFSSEANRECVREGSVHVNDNLDTGFISHDPIATCSSYIENSNSVREERDPINARVSVSMTLDVVVPNNNQLISQSSARLSDESNNNRKIPKEFSPSIGRDEDGDSDISEKRIGSDAVDRLGMFVTVVGCNEEENIDVSASENRESLLIDALKEEQDLLTLTRQCLDQPNIKKLEDGKTSTQNKQYPKDDKSIINSNTLSKLLRNSSSMGGFEHFNPQMELALQEESIEAEVLEVAAQEENIEAQEENIEAEVSEVAEQEENIEAEVHAQIHNVGRPERFEYSTSYICDYCGDKFSQIIELRSHMEVPHNHKCNGCFRSFEDSTSLSRHRRIHEDSKPIVSRGASSSRLCIESKKATGFSCKVCGRMWSSVQHLQKHMKVHKTFTCHLCYKSFQKKYYLIMHIKSHTVKKYVTCLCCGGGFESEETLEKHLEMHINMDAAEAKNAVQCQVLEVGEVSADAVESVNSACIRNSDKSMILPVDPVSVNSSSYNKDLSDLVGEHNRESLNMKGEEISVRGNDQLLPNVIYNNCDTEPKYIAENEGQNNSSFSLMGIEYMNDTDIKVEFTDEERHVESEIPILLVENEGNVNSNLELDGPSDSTVDDKFVHWSQQEEPRESKVDERVDTLMSEETESLAAGYSDFLCSKCGKIFSCKVSYRTHMKIPHNHKCTNCNQSFRLPQGLVEHKKMHLNSNVGEQKGFLYCKLCGKCCPDRMILEIHMETHNEYSCHSCHVCGRSFPLRRRLQKHMRFHRRPNKCSVCDKVFCYSSVLNRHMQSHSKRNELGSGSSVVCKFSQIENNSDVWAITGLVRDVNSDDKCKD